MTVLKESEKFESMYNVKLENGVLIYVFGEYAKDEDGRTYYHVGKEENDILITVGWSSDIEKAVVLS